MSLQKVPQRVVRVNKDVPAEVVCEGIEELAAAGWLVQVTIELPDGVLIVFRHEERPYIPINYRHLPNC